MAVFTRLDNHSRVGQTGHSQRNRRPATRNHRAAGPRSVVSTRPLTFTEWWDWGVAQADAAQHDPLKLHDEDGALHDVESARNADAITGWPFTFRFLRTLEHDFAVSPMRRALAGMRPRHMGRRREPISVEEKILVALLGRHVDPDTVWGILGRPHRKFFEERVVFALGLVWQQAETAKMRSLLGFDVEVDPSSAQALPRSEVREGSGETFAMTIGDRMLEQYGFIPPSHSKDDGSSSCAKGCPYSDAVATS